MSYMNKKVVHSHELPQDDDDIRGFGLESGKVAEKFFFCASNLFSIIFQPNGR